MTYSHTIEEVNSTRRKFRIAVAPAVIKEAFNAAVTEIQKSADVRGFRKGKVPPSMVRKFFENDVRKNAFNRVVEAGYQDAVRSAEVQIVSYPQIEPEGKFDEKSDFVYTATVDINPQLNIQGYKDLKLTVDSDQSLDSDVRNELERLGRAIGKFEKDTAQRAVTTDDFVNVSYVGKIGNEAFKGGSADNQRLELGRNALLPDFEAGVIGAMPGETRTFDVVFPADYGEASLRGKTGKFTLTVNYLEKLELPEMNDEFAKKFGTDTMENLKRSLRSYLSDAAERSKLQVLQDQIIDQLLEKNTFEVPESLVESTIDRAVVESNSRLGKKDQLDAKNEEVRARFRDMAAVQVRGVLALGNIARVEGITVADNELGPELVNFARANNMTPDELIRQAGREVIEEIRGRVLLSKVIKHLVGLNQVGNATAAQPEVLDAPAAE